MSERILAQRYIVASAPPGGGDYPPGTVVVTCTATRVLIEPADDNADDLFVGAAGVVLSPEVLRDVLLEAYGGEGSGTTPPLAAPEVASGVAGVDPARQPGGDA